MTTHQHMPRREALKAAGASLAVGAISAAHAGTSKGTQEPVMPTEQPDRHQLGITTLGSITGGTGDAVVQSLKDVAPDLAEWIIAFAYGDVLSRPGLDKRSRQFATVAALTAMGTAAPQLKVHLHGALNVGCTPNELIETVLQMTVYAGFPSALNALGIAREVFRERGVSVAPAR